MRRELSELRRISEAGNPLGLIDAILFCCQLNLPLPAWTARPIFNEFVLPRLEGKARGRKGRGRHANLRPEILQRHKDYDRYEAVIECRKNKEKLKRHPGWTVYKYAQRVVEGTFSAGSVSAIQRSYERVRKSRTPYRYYLGRYTGIYLGKPIPLPELNAEKWQALLKPSIWKNPHGK